MSHPDDAAWIAAAGAPRPADASSADIFPRYDRPVPAATATDDAADPDPQVQESVDVAEVVSSFEPVADDAQIHVDDAFDPIAEAQGTPDREVAEVDAVESDDATPGDQEIVPALIPKPAPAEAELGPTGRPRRVIPEPAVLNSHGPARVIAMCNQKGGVGKTTTTLNLGASLAEYGRRVLLVDLDPQGALSAGLGVPSHELDHTIYNLMLERNTTITDVLVPTRVPGLDLLPANIDLSAAEVQLINEVGREHTLARALRPMLHEYDYILIDCQPSLGLLTVNALACAHGVIMPVAAEFFSLRGVALLVDTIDKVKDRINPDLEVDGVLVTMFDGRTVHARDVVAMLVQRFGDEVYDTVVSRTVKFPETTVAGEPITTYAPTSPAAEAFRALAREVIAR
nr:ParA family protein [Nakamurella panacisegetis]